MFFRRAGLDEGLADEDGIAASELIEWLGGGSDEWGSRTPEPGRPGLTRVFVGDRTHTCVPCPTLTGAAGYALSDEAASG